jgi:ATP-binding cassette subfamily B protein
MVGAVLLVAGGIAVIRHALTVGGLLAYFAAAALAGAQVERLIACMPVLAEGAAALARLQAYLSAPRAPGYAGRRKIDWSGQVAIEGVDFAYGERPVLESVSLTLPPGRRVGVLGSNGAGKTTLLNLILGLCRPGAGRLSADGVAFDDLDLAAQRRMIGLAPQEPVFFDGSVFDNIAYGAPGLTREAVANLAERIGASRLIDRLPGGLDAPLGEGGLRLSGGERQMIAILRALAPRPRLLLLDEPTNHLDLTATRGVLDALATWPDRPGIVLVSHDPAAMAGLNAVYRIDAARLREVCPTDT